MPQLMRPLLKAFLCLASLASAVVALAQTCSIPGQAGTVTALNSQPNTFFPGTGNVAASATSIAVGASTGVARAIAAGDLLLVIQMQGADFDTDNDNGYGDGVTHAGVTSTVAIGVNGYAGGAPAGNFYAGTYEWAVAAGPVATGGGTIPLSAPLQNAYYTQAGGGGATAFKRAFQVIRVPQYARATLTGNLTVQGWNGSTGGVLAIDAAGDLNLATFTINGSGRGFRGGGSVNGTPLNSTCTGTWNPPPAACQHYRQPINIPGADSTTAYWGGSKGEGCSGTPGRLYSVYNNTHVAGATGSDGYPNGDMGRGAPCNAGGGGNAHNSGGGGGGNGGAGGRGGNSWNSSTANNVGHAIGGFGGATSWGSIGGPAVNRLFMGGGGGAGDLGGNANAVPNGSGGAGGAIVILHASRIVSNGATINVNGESAPNVPTTDAAGGGGAGGTVVVKANSLNGTLNVTANGGAGGNYEVDGAEQDGAGGGGGGGVLFTNVAPTFTATAGAAGVSSSDNCAPSNPGLNCGQAAGNAGTGTPGYAVFAPGVRTGYECMPNITVTKSTTTPVVTAATGAVANYVVTVSNSGGGVRFAELYDWNLPPGWTLAPAAGSVEYGPALPLAAGRLSTGAETVARTHVSDWNVAADPLTTPAAGSNQLSVSSFAIAPIRAGVPAAITFTFTASIPDTATVGTYHNGIGISFLDPTRASATTRAVSPAVDVNANRTTTSYGSTTYANFNGGTGTNVAGSNYSGLAGGPTTEDVRLVPDFSISKSGSATATVGGTFIYTLTPRNNGRPIAAQTYSATQATTVAAASVGATLGSSPLTVTDTLPAGITLTTAFTGTNWTCSGLTTNTPVCTRTDANAYPIAASTDYPAITATAQVTCSAATARTNTAVISVGAGETLTSNNTATFVTTAPGCANLSVTKTNGGTSLGAGATTSYTVTVANLGPGSAAGTVVTDPAQAGLNCTAVSCSTTGTASCPSPLTISALQSTGLTITPTFDANSTVNFVITCGVTATGQ